MLFRSPTDVRAVIDALSADYARLSPADAADFSTEHASVIGTNLKEYFDLVSAIKARYAGTPIGASESIIAPLAQATGLELITPAALLSAVSEGSDPTAQDKATADAQIAGHQIEVYVYNTQNDTPDVQRQVSAARSAGIPVVTVTETLTGTSFQDWQVRQLRDLSQALAKATGR